MPLRQAAALHHARYRGGFHSAASLTAAQAGMKFAVAHNIPALATIIKTPHFTASGKVAKSGLKCNVVASEKLFQLSHL